MKIRAILAAAVLLTLPGMSTPVEAQQAGTVTGRVINAGTRAPLAGVQVQVVGTQLGALSNAEGQFLILNVPAGAVQIRAQSLGYRIDPQRVTVAAGQTATVNFEAQEDAISIAPVVVTALGIERSEKSLGYAVQSISSTDIARSPEVTLASALAAQSAGVQVVSSSGRPGASSRVTIRGESSFTGSGQPLYVIDGMPISVDVDSRGQNVLEFGSAGSRGMDIDPNNIEEISVLRGAAATALYGSRAAAGAILIRTKQGVAGAPMRIQVSSQVRMDQPILDGYTTQYAAGLDGYYCNGRLADQGGWCQPGYPAANPNPATMLNWGPHKDSIPQSVIDAVGPVRFRDAREDFFRNGRVLENSINASGSLPAGTYNLGASHLGQQGIVPNAKLDRLNLNANVLLNLTSWLASTTTVMHANTANDFQSEGYQGSVTRLLINLPPNWDIREAWRPDGSPVMWGTNTPHPQWSALNEYNGERTNRWIASQFFSMSAIPGVTISNRIGLDTYVAERQDYQNERPWRTAAGLASGGTVQQKITNSRINNDLVMTLDRLQLREGFTATALVGGNLYMQQDSDLRGWGTNVSIPGFYNLSNFETQRVSGTLTRKRRLVGMYSQATLDYNDWAFLTLTGRNDWSSTLPTSNNNYFYPSAAVGVVFTDALDWRNALLQYGKLRLSIAKVGSDAPPYSLSTRYFSASPTGANNGIQQNGGPNLTFPFRGQNAYFQSTNLGNPDLKPESTVETEVGLELRLLDGRARLDISAYNKSSYDQIFSVPSSAATGYTSIVRNAGDLRNRGVEVSLQAVPVRTQNFSWDLRANWSRNRSEVLSLAPGVTSIYLAGYAWPQIRIMAGEEYGVIWGYPFARNDNGDVLVSDAGLPILSTNLGVIGNTQPDWLGNLSTQVHYRGFGLSGLLDIRRGGEILNFETQYTVNNGRSKITESRGQTTVYPGVNVNTGQPNTVQVVKDRAYFNAVYGFDRHENMVEPAGFVKLREVTLSYAVPRSLAARASAENLNLYVSGRNLAVWSDFSMGDPEGDNYGGTNAGGAYYRFFPLPQTRSWSVGVRASF